MEVLMLIVLLVSGALAIRYGLGMSSSRHDLRDRLVGSFLAAVGVGALYFGLAIVRAML